MLGEPEAGRVEGPELEATLGRKHGPTRGLWLPDQPAKFADETLQHVPCHDSNGEPQNS